MMFSPWLIMFLSLIATLGMCLLARRGTHGWRLIALTTIPFSLCLVYGWIGLMELTSEQARMWVRFDLVYSLTVAIYVIYSYYITEAQSQKRRHNDR